MSFFNDDTVFILDSYGLIYREYFAFINRPLTNSKHENVSALFGFFRNLSLILKTYSPKHMIAAMDSKTPTFRHEKYPEYKATRAKTPDDLKAQFPWIEECLQILGIPVVRVDGYEADDVVATVARICDRNNRHCCILSADKDLQQLTNSNIHIMKPDRQKVWAELDEEGVLADWGVGPEKLLDLLSLTGDTADNVPGVKGVGDKTAVKLLSEYGTLEGIYQHANEIKGVLGEKIRSSKENAFFSKELITLCETVPLEQCNNENPLKFCDISELDYAGFAAEMTRRELPALAKTYSGMKTSGTVKSSFSQVQSVQEPQDEPLQVSQNKGNYRACTDSTKLMEFVDQAIRSRTVAFDTETDSLDTYQANLVGFSLSFEKGCGIYVPLQLNNDAGQTIIDRKTASQALRKLFESDIDIIMHNGKFDLKVLMSNGILGENESKPIVTKKRPQQDQLDLFGDNDASGIGSAPEASQSDENSGKPDGNWLPGRPITSLKCRIHDTMIAAWLLEPDRSGKNAYSLEYLAETKLGLKGTEYQEIVPKDGNFADVALETAANYGAEDSDFTLQLWQYFEPKLKDAKLMELYSQMEMKVLPILAEMETNGIHLNSDYLKDYAVVLNGEIQELAKKIYETVGHEFNIASPKQLSVVLFEERGLQGTKKTKTGWSTDTDVLETLAALDPVPKMILDYRAKAKLLSTYVETLPEDCDTEGRIHTTFLQTGTATGRLSSKEPNLQNIPVRSEEGRKIRSAFTAPQGKVLVSADYAQIELVVLAHLSGDKNLCEAFNQGTDVHKSTAALIYGVSPDQVTSEMRRNAKTLNFGLMYGMGAFSLAKDLGISRTQAMQFIENYFAVYSGVKAFFDENVRKAEENGYVETIMGRRRYIQSINSKNKMEKEGAIRIAKNTPIQGSAADIVKKAMIAVCEGLKETGSNAKMLLQVHDELILECDDDEKSISDTIALIQDKMEHAVRLDVPLRVSVEHGKAWGEFH